MPPLLAAARVGPWLAPPRRPPRPPPTSLSRCAALAPKGSTRTGGSRRRAGSGPPQARRQVPAPQDSAPCAGRGGREEAEEGAPPAGGGRGGARAGGERRRREGGRDAEGAESLGPPPDTARLGRGLTRRNLELPFVRKRNLANFKTQTLGAGGRTEKAGRPKKEKRKTKKRKRGRPRGKTEGGGNTSGSGGGRRLFTPSQSRRSKGGVAPGPLVPPVRLVPPGEGPGEGPPEVATVAARRRPSPRGKARDGLPAAPVPRRVGEPVEPPSVPVPGVVPAPPRETGDVGAEGPVAAEALPRAAASQTQAEVDTGTVTNGPLPAASGISALRHGPEGSERPPTRWRRVAWVHQVERITTQAPTTSGASLPRGPAGFGSARTVPNPYITCWP